MIIKTEEFIIKLKTRPSLYFSDVVKKVLLGPLGHILTLALIITAIVAAIVLVSQFDEGLWQQWPSP